MTHEIRELEWYDRASGNFLVDDAGFTLLIEFGLDPEWPDHPIQVKARTLWFEEPCDVWGEEAPSVDSPVWDHLHDELRLDAETRIDEFLAGIKAESLLKLFPQSAVASLERVLAYVTVLWDEPPVRVLVDQSFSEPGVAVFCGDKPRAEAFSKSLKQLIARWTRVHADHAALVSALQEVLGPLSIVCRKDSEVDSKDIARVVDGWFRLRQVRRDEDLCYELITQTLLEGAARGWATDRVIAKDLARRVFDSTRFKVENPDLWESYSKTVTSQILAPISAPSKRKPISTGPTQALPGGGPDTDTFATFASASAAAKALAKQGIRARVRSTGGIWRVVR